MGQNERGCVPPASEAAEHAVKGSCLTVERRDGRRIGITRNVLPDPAVHPILKLFSAPHYTGDGRSGELGNGLQLENVFHYEVRVVAWANSQQTLDVVVPTTRRAEPKGSSPKAVARGNATNIIVLQLVSNQKTMWEKVE